MADIKIKSDLNFGKIGKAITPAVAKQIGLAITEGIKEMLATSKSPVKGYGSFEPYAVQRGIKNGYPIGVPGKRVRPVNLQLTGDMIGSIKVLSSSGDTVSIGIASGKQSRKAETHNEGTQVGRVPQRKFLPTGNGEEFAISIQRKILAILEKAVFDRLKKP